MKKILAITVFLVASVSFGGVSHADAMQGGYLLCTFVIDEHPGAVSGSASCFNPSTLKQYSGPVSTAPYAPGPGGCPAPNLDFAVFLNDGHGDVGYGFTSWINRVAVPAMTTSSALVVGFDNGTSLPMIGSGSMHCGPGGFSAHLNVVGVVAFEACVFSGC